MESPTATVPEPDTTNPSPFNIPSANEQNRDRVKKRVEAVATIIRESGGVAPAYREIQRQLKARGCVVSLGTIASCMAALGKTNSPSLYRFKSLNTPTE